MMQALRNLWNPSIFPLLCGLYGGEWIDISVPSLVTTSLKSLFLNSVPLSIKIFTHPPNGQAIWFLYAVTTSSAVFVFNGTHHVNPVSIQQAVNAKQWPHLVGGWNSPIKSIQMKSIGDMEIWRDEWAFFETFYDLCSMHTGQSLQCCQTFSLIFFQ